MINYNCLTCQDPMKVSIHFMAYIKSNGPTKQHCTACGAIHMIHPDKQITLHKPGALVARLSQEFPYPEYKPYRVGPYRVRYSSGNWAKSYITWDGDAWRNGNILFHSGSIIAWQGLGGDMEHYKTMPYEHSDPIPYTPGDGE